MRSLSYLEPELAALETAGLLRQVSAAQAEPGLVVACSNDYLGYGCETVSRETLLSCADVPGSGASRLVCGTTTAHAELEAFIAQWLGAECALLFSSGYAANLGTVAALAGPRDVIFSDQLNHASLTDGCRLSRAQTVVFPHLDLAELERQLHATPSEGHRFVVSESYFSMDGDSPDLAALEALCARFDAHLLLDEAHALGVFGPSGSGLARACGVTPSVTLGTLGKAAATHGAFSAGESVLRDWLWNRARSLVFSTAPSPVLARLSLGYLRRLVDDDEGRARLQAHCERFADLLRSGGLHLSPRRTGPIFSIVLGTPQRALEASARLRRTGFLVQAIRPPTVPPGSSRLRVTLNAAFTPELVERLALAVVQACA